MIRAELDKEEIMLGDTPREESMEIAMLNLCLGTYYHDWGDQDKTAMPYADQAVMFSEYYLGEFNPWSYARHGKSIFDIALDSYLLQANILTQLNKFITAGKVYAKARGHATKYRLYFDATNYANYLTKTGRLAEAEPLLFAQLAYAEEMFRNPEYRHLWVEHRGYLAHEIARMLREDGRFEEAIRYHTMAISVYSQTRPADHPYVAVVKSELARTLIESKTQLDKAELILEEAYPVLTRAYEETHLNIANYKMHLFELLMQKGDVDKADQYYNEASEILKLKIGIESRAIYTGLLRMFLAVNEQRVKGEITEEEYLASGEILVAAVLPNLDKLKRLFSVYNPILIDILGFCYEILIIRGKSDNANTLKQTIDECRRIARDRVAIRTAGLDMEQVWEDKEQLLKNMAEAISLPSFDDVDVLKITVPFYEGVALYKIIYKKAATAPKRYVLSDGEILDQIDYSPATIEKLAPYFRLNTDNALLYLRFYYDASCDDIGFTYIITDRAEIPWRLDITLSDADKEFYSSHVKPYRILEADDDSIRAEAYYIIGEQLMRGQFEIGYNGEIRKLISDPCYFRADGSIVFRDSYVNEITGNDVEESYFDQDHNTIVLDPGEVLIGTIPAGIDPRYKEEIDFDSLDQKSKLRESLTACDQLLQFVWGFSIVPETEGLSIAQKIDWLSNINIPVSGEWLLQYREMLKALIVLIQENKEALIGELSDNDNADQIVENQITGLGMLDAIAEELQNAEAKAD